ncbi:phage major capsid protein [Salipaludibacillus sp. HK11]|uniref:phage major capsid protein n=1 Tax=Salipaludibacillus sp. HK11 TaxID=3394320 RepID=UPI0039FBE592
MKKWLKDQLKKKEEKRAALKTQVKELRGKIEESKTVDEAKSLGKEARTIESNIEELDSDIDGYTKQLADLPDEDPEGRGKDKDKDHDDDPEQRSTPAGQLNPMGTYSMGNAQGVGDEKRQKDLETKYETRGANLKAKQTVDFDIDELPELRAVTVGGGTLVVEKKYSDTLNGNFNEVSTLIDRVNGVPLMGGESYTKGFEVSDGEGDYTSEDGNYTETDPEFGYVTMGKAKITAYAEISDEAMKLPNVNYQSSVASSVGKALRKKITRQILVGAGGANALTGIFNAPTNVIPVASDIEVAEIGPDTLDQIVFGYGGDEEIEGGAFLIVNKLDLAAFSKVRSTDGKKLYKIKKEGNTGTISSDDSFEVPFIINSSAPALSADGTVADTYCLAYGFPQAYEMPVFSAVTVEESRDYKFRTGQIAYRGSVWAGGNVSMHKGFVRVKKVTAT